VKLWKTDAPDSGAPTPTPYIQQAASDTASDTKISVFIQSRSGSFFEACALIRARAVAQHLVASLCFYLIMAHVTKICNMGSLVARAMLVLCLCYVRAIVVAAAALDFSIAEGILVRKRCTHV